ncbi:hypothetical protein C8R46DRAFT_1098169 [Mycena filopes]|nr:hypothetical protein C8R46DRAFT_1098169 [Mycena filopes]
MSIIISSLVHILRVSTCTVLGPHSWICDRICGPRLAQCSYLPPLWLALFVLAFALALLFILVVAILRFVQYLQYILRTLLHISGYIPRSSLERLRGEQECERHRWEARQRKSEGQLATAELASSRALNQIESLEDSLIQAVSLNHSLTCTVSGFASTTSQLEDSLDHIESLKDSLTCTVCLNLFQRPYVASCGHVSDLGCLQKWFHCAPRSEHPSEAHLNVDDVDYVMRRSKSCPVCRAPVSDPPIPVHSLNATLDILRAGLVDEDNGRAIAVNTRDPWVGIFMRSTGHSYRLAHTAFSS